MPTMAARATMEKPMLNSVIWGMAAIGLACVAFVTWFWLTHATAETPGDTHNYILAGLRLNAGHPLYGYGPGDLHVLPVPATEPTTHSSRRP